LLRQLDFLEGEVTILDAEVAKRLAPFEDLIQRLDRHPGIGRRSAEDILAEIGTDMSRFPTVDHLCSWARVCPGNDESAGKRRSGRTGHANRCALLSPRRPSPRLGSAAATFRPNTAASPLAAVRSGLSSPLLTLSSSTSTTCSPAKPNTETWATSISTAST